MSDSSTHLVEIDYLRGVAILLTLLAHLAFMQSTPSPIYIFVINNIAQFWGGVILFFTISGFVISRSFMDMLTYNKSPMNRDYKIACKVFYYRRLFRIVPTAIAWILITIMFSLNFNEFGSFGNIKSVLTQAFAATFFIYNVLTPWIVGPALSIYWSLSFEEQFYLLFPFLSRLNTDIKIFILLSIIALFFMIHRLPDQSRLINSFPLDAICYGVLIKIIHDSKYSEKLKPLFLANKKYRNLNLVLSISVIIFSPIIFKKLICGTSILVFAGAWLVFCASYNNKFIEPPETIGKILRILGKCSFSLYCCHMSAYLVSKEIAFYFKQAYGLNVVILNFLSFLIAVLLCITFTFLSMILIEKPTRIYGRHQFRKLSELHFKPIST